MKKIFYCTAISWHLRKQVGVITCPIHDAFDAFLQVKRINRHDNDDNNKKLNFTNKIKI